MYTIKEECHGRELEHGVFESIKMAERFRWDDNGTIVPVSDEKARRLILGGIYDDTCEEYSAEYAPYPDVYDDELEYRLFDYNVSMYIEDKRPGWKLLLDYNPEKDNPM